LYLTDEDCEDQSIEKERTKEVRHLQNERRGRRDEAEGEAGVEAAKESRKSRSRGKKCRAQ